MAQIHRVGNVGIIVVGSIIAIAALVAILVATEFLPLNLSSSMLSTEFLPLNLSSSMLSTEFLPLNLSSSILSTGTKSEYTEPILSGVVSVDAGEFQYEQFEVPADASVPIVRGSFFVSGGNAESINVIIVDGDGFTSWQNGEAPEVSHYFSSQVITADLEAKVPSGVPLYLIFDNIHSSASKSIEAEIELAYLR